MKRLTDEQIKANLREYTPTAPKLDVEMFLDFHHHVGIRGKSHAHKDYLIDEKCVELAGRGISWGDHSRVLLTEKGTLYVMQPYAGGIDHEHDRFRISKILDYCESHAIPCYIGAGWYYPGRTIALAIGYHEFIKSLSTKR